MPLILCGWEGKEEGLLEKLVHSFFLPGDVRRTIFTDKKQQQQQQQQQSNVARGITPGFFHGSLGNRGFLKMGYSS